MWKHTDGTTDETYTAGAKFVPDAGWETDSNYENATLVRVVKDDDGAPVAAFRAKLTRDDDPMAPDYGMGCPVYGYEYRYGADVAQTASTGSDSDAHSGIDFRESLMHFYNRTPGNFRQAIKNTDRWLRIFHGGSIGEISHSYSQSGSDYLVYDTRAMREFWGCTGEQLETSDPSNYEWQAYIDGDVYGVEVERTFDLDEDGEVAEDAEWDELDGAVWGHFGEDWAKQSAEDKLDDAVKDFDVAARKAEVKVAARKRRIVITLDFNESVDPDFIGELSGSPVGNIMADLSDILAEDPLLAGFDIEEKR